MSEKRLRGQGSGFSWGEGGQERLPVHVPPPECGWPVDSRVGGRRGRRGTFRQRQSMGTAEVGVRGVPGRGVVRLEGQPRAWRGNSGPGWGGRALLVLHGG